MPTSTRAARAPGSGSGWTFWPAPDVDDGIDGYTPGFLFKIDLPVLIGLVALFFVPPVRSWTGVNPWILVPAFALHFGFAYHVMRSGLYRRRPQATEFLSHVTNLVAAVAIPLSTSKALFILWLLYLLVVWIDAFSNPKAVTSLALTVVAPWADPLWHSLRAATDGSFSAGFPSVIADKAMLAGLASVLGAVCCLVISHYSLQARLARRALARQEGERATLEERARIGQNLHGTLGAALSEITLWHEIALAGGGADLRAATGADPLSDPLSRAHARAKSALTDLRSLVAGLDEESITAANLCAGIRRQIEGLCAAADVTLEFTDPPDGSRDMASAYHIAKVVVEGVTNAVKHARATRVQVSLALSPVSLSIRDDGVGFDTAHATKGRGLRSLHEHAEALGGTLDIVSAAGAGTTLILRAGPA